MVESLEELRSLSVDEATKFLEEFVGRESIVEMRREKYNGGTLCEIESVEELMDTLLIAKKAKAKELFGRLEKWKKDGVVVVKRENIIGLPAPPLETKKKKTTAAAPARDRRTEEKRAVAFYDFDAASVLFWAGKLLEEPWSRPVILVETDDIPMWRMLGPGKVRGFCAGSDDDVFELSSVIVVGDTALVTSSPEKLQRFVDFYEKGNTVVVLPQEGIFDIGESLKSLFGIQGWRLCNTDNVTCAMTPRGKELLGQSAPLTVDLEKAHLLLTPPNDALYFEKPQTRKDFGLPDDGPADDMDDEESFSAYLDEFKPGTALALHTNPRHNGRLAYFGDYLRSDSTSRLVFAHLCDIAH